MNPEDYYVIAEPKSPWRRDMLEFFLSGGTAEERFDVFVAIRFALGRSHLVHSAPTAEWEPITTSYRRRRVKEILLPVRAYLPPPPAEGEQVVEQAADGHAGQRRVAKAARKEGHPTRMWWARRP